jgi:hypothetical protein
MSGLSTAKRLRPSAQGCRCGYPGERKINYQPQRGCVICTKNSHNRRNRNAVVGRILLLSQGSRSGNLGLEGVTASRLSSGNTPLIAFSEMLETPGP